MLNPQLILLVLAIAVAAPSWATVPQALSFQGYLTDRVGSPIVDSQTITFSIYVVPVGGVPVWQETKSVAFSNGLFSTRLGELTSFPSDLFDVPLWIGMTVGTDSEMEPRRPLTTAGFSFRAEDSDTLQGHSAAELDQSGHVDDLSNPHTVTAAQTGAATQAGLDTHVGDTGNPHAVSVGQTGGTPAGTFSAHAAGGSAHHPRYADAEAVTAMGTRSATNPLNHERYADSEAVGAMLAADGEGSGLDADSVDGADGMALQASITQAIDALATLSEQVQEIENLVNAFPTLVVRDVTENIGYYISGPFYLDGPSGLGITVFHPNGFTATVKATGQLSGQDLWYDNSDCTGATFISSPGSTIDNTVVTPRVFTGIGNSEDGIFYSPIGTTPMLLNQPHIYSNGDCSPFDPPPLSLYPVSPNDSSITGFAGGPYDPPITVGTPR